VNRAHGILNFPQFRSSSSLSRELIMNRAHGTNIHQNPEGSPSQNTWTPRHINSLRIWPCFSEDSCLLVEAGDENGRDLLLLVLRPAKQTSRRSSSPIPCNRNDLQVQSRGQPKRQYLSVVVMLHLICTVWPGIRLLGVRKVPLMVAQIKEAIIFYKLWSSMWNIH
jgi:hypothetical protein